MARARTPKTTKLPPALAKNAAKKSAARRGLARAEALALLADFRIKKKVVEDAFYDMGVILKRLREPEMLEALEVASFDALCRLKLRVAVSFAAGLIAVVERMTRSQALEVGQTRAIELVALAKATPAADTPASLARDGKLRVPGAPSVDPGKATASQLRGAARAFRQRSADAAAAKGGKRRGLTTTKTERDLAGALDRALRGSGTDRCELALVAARPAAVLRCDIPVDQLAAFAKAALAAAKK